MQVCGELRFSGAGTATGIELADVLNALEATPREIVVLLHVWGQLSWQEIADVVGGSKSAAQRHYVTALEQLRSLWEPQTRETKSCPTK